MSAIVQLAERETWAALCLGLALLAAFLGWRLWASRRRSTARDDGILDAIPFPIWQRRRDGALGFVNKAYLDIVNVTRAEALAGQIEIGDRRDFAHRRAMAARAQKTGVTLTESQYVVVDGTRQLIEITEIPLPGGGLGLALDRTNLEEVQAALSQHLAAHDEVLEVLRAGIAVFGSDRRLRFFNTAFTDLWRLSPEELDGEPNLGQVLDLLQDRRQLPEEVDFGAFKERQNRLFSSLLAPDEGLMHLPDDRTLRFIVSPHPLGGLLFVYEDVTDRMALERSYNTLIDVQRTSIDNLRQAVATFGGDGRLRLYNPPFQQLWNFNPAKLQTGPHIADLAATMADQIEPSDQIDHDATAAAELVSRITEPRLRSGRIERRDGRILAYNVVPLPDSGCMLTYLDVTDTVHVQRDLQERATALEIADKVKSQFIANISYELRTPLNAIIGFAELLQQRIVGDLNNRQMDYVGYIRSASDHLQTLITDILDLATIEAGYLELDHEPVALKPLMAGLIDLVRDRAESGGVTLALDCPDDIGTLDADPTRLRQALFNLVSNAVKFTPDGGSVSLTARRDAEAVSLTVTETGVGFDFNDRDRLLEKFEVGNPNARESGPGLGLALSKSLVELHGGSIDLVSALAEGTTATCIFPAAAAQTEKEQPEAARGDD
jgi:signal transduction histidine kinase